MGLMSTHHAELQLYLGIARTVGSVEDGAIFVTLHL